MSTTGKSNEGSPIAAAVAVGCTTDVGARVTGSGVAGAAAVTGAAVGCGAPAGAPRYSRGVSTMNNT
ncbi:MAG: hypothetical protein ACE5FI_05895, partial [Anaerolineales bacterium]